MWTAVNKGGALYLGGRFRTYRGELTRNFMVIESFSGARLD